MPELRDLVVVAGHATFRAEVREAPATPEDDRWWVLLPFQVGEPPFYIAHIRRGVELAAADPGALLLFSGGRTRRTGGTWTEGRTYLEVARTHDFWRSEVGVAAEARIDTEEFARDSFENVLFGICRFAQVTGRYPRRVTLVSWAFKRERFERHRAAIRFPAARFRFDGVDDPVDLESALRGERQALADFAEHPYGSAGSLAEKRASRDPFGARHDYAGCPDLRDYFPFIEDPSFARSEYPHRLPWESVHDGEP